MSANRASGKVGQVARALSCRPVTAAGSASLHFLPTGNEGRMQSIVFWNSSCQWFPGTRRVSLQGLNPGIYRTLACLDEFVGGPD